MQQVPTAAAVPAGVPLAEVRSFLMESLPGAAVAHSFHVEALMDPSLRTNAAFQRFSLIELNELHHQIAAVGALLRAEMGDATALRALDMNMTAFLANRQAAMRLVPSLSPAVRSNPRVQAVLSLINESNEQIAQNAPLIQRVTAFSRAPAPQAMMVGRP